MKDSRWVVSKDYNLVELKEDLMDILMGKSRAV
jgi:hypothetical protein